MTTEPLFFSYHQRLSLLFHSPSQHKIPSKPQWLAPSQWTHPGPPTGEQPQVNLPCGHSLHSPALLYCSHNGKMIHKELGLRTCSQGPGKDCRLCCEPLKFFINSWPPRNHIKMLNPPLGILCVRSWPHDLYRHLCTGQHSHTIKASCISAPDRDSII